MRRMLVFTILIHNDRSFDAMDDKVVSNKGADSYNITKRAASLLPAAWLWLAPLYYLFSLSHTCFTHYLSSFSPLWSIYRYYAVLGKPVVLLK
jgi:hypothetical protein